MKVKVEKLEGSKAKLEVVLTKEEFNDVISGGYTYDQQKESFSKFMAIMNKHGISIRTFAPPNDSESQTTVKVISENFPHIDTVMHFDYLEMAEGMINLENDGPVTIMLESRG